MISPRKISYRSLFFAVLSVFILLSSSFAAALSQEQVKVLNNSIFYYDVSADACSVSGANKTIGQSIDGSISKEKAPEPLRSKIIKASQDAGVPAGAIAGLYLAEQNGSSFFRVHNTGDTELDDLFKSINKDSTFWHKGKLDSKKWTKASGFGGPFQLSNAEWETYGDGGDTNNFDDAAAATSRYFKVLMDKAKENLNTDDQVKLVNSAASTYNGQVRSGLDGQNTYGAQVTKLSGLLSTNGNAATASNTDYAGNAVLNQAQLDAISENMPIYEQAADEVGLPWQMIAVIHVRESNLAKANPGNGQGIYQFVSKQGGPYPTGPVDDSEFLRQTKLAADFLKNKAAGSNYAANRDLSTSSNPDVIKDTFFSYNGRASAYSKQAAKLGYDQASQGFEGSPYVMNRADVMRDPNVNKTTWGQIKRDFGGIEYPANGDYGAFVQYAALTGTAIGASGGSSNCVAANGDSGSSANVNCSGPANTTADLSAIRQQVVCIAQEELAKWESGAMHPGGGKDSYYKYSHDVAENWCADFVSWIYNQAGQPLRDANEGKVAAVLGIWSIGESGTNGFSYHKAGSYTPRPGDLVIYKTGASHVNMVVSVSGNSMTLIGGNQKTYNINTSLVSKYQSNRISGGDITGYVSPD